MQPDILIDETALRNAIHNTFALAYAQECEEEGIRLGGGCVSEQAPRQPDAVLMPLAWYLIGRTQQAWGYPVGLVFHHAGIEGEEMQEDALTDLFLGIQGHGVGLEDDYSGEIGKAESLLGGSFDCRPFEDELAGLRDAAREVMIVEGHITREHAWA